MVDHRWLLVVERFAAVPKRERKGRRRRRADINNKDLPILTFWLAHSKRQTDHGDAEDDDGRFGGMMRRVAGPGTMSLDGETQKREAKRVRLAARHTTQTHSWRTRRIKMCVRWGRVRRWQKLDLADFSRFSAGARGLQWAALFEIVWHWPKSGQVSKYWLDKDNYNSNCLLRITKKLCEESSQRILSILINRITLINIKSSEKFGF